MPISTVGGGAQQVQQLLKQVQNQIKPSAPGQHNFAQVLGNKMGVEQAGASAPVQNAQLVKAQKVPIAIKSLFNNWSKDSNTMHKITQIALSGQQFTPSQLLGLQQATYKVTFELETMSKLVEQASSAVKTTMQTQV